MAEQVPTREDWADAEHSDDLDVRYAFETYFGRALAFVRQRILNNPIEVVHEIGDMPALPFRYYLRAYRDYLLADDSAADSDAASCYLRLIRDKLESEPAKMLLALPEHMQAVQTVASRQAFYDADVEIYGDFREHAAAIDRAFKKATGPNK